MPYYNDTYLPPAGNNGQESNRPVERKSVMAKGLVVIGVIQILLGLLIIFVGVYRLLAACQLSNLATGMWVGAFIMFEGIIGIIAGQNREEKTLTSFTVLSFLAMVLVIILASIEGVALTREISDCDPLTSAVCVPLCFFSSNNLVFLGLFEVAFCFTAALIAMRITRRTSQVEPLQTGTEPLPRWAVPSLYALERRYMEDYLAQRVNQKISPARRYDSSTQTRRAQFDDDRYTFP